MTLWYNPVLLVRTAIRVTVSSVFGQFADRREAIAAANAISAQPFDSSYDYSSKTTDGDFWLDYMADTGDGWNSTFAMAQLVTEPSLKLKGAGMPLKRGRVLILGGDQVYPTASRETYSDRFLGPFQEAYEQLAPAQRTDMPDLYAIPGNHDWYDGLSAFVGIFCRRQISAPRVVGVSRPGKEIAGRPTCQTRSYFAIRLPGGWWLWAVDSQLAGYVDQPQVDYFHHVAKNWMERKSKLILCVSTPAWTYTEEEEQPAFENFSYLERLVELATDNHGRPMGHRLKLVLSGDSHHYSRYVEGGRHYVTAGGGGAFLHPTHHLRDNDLEDVFAPDRSGRGARRFTIAKKDGEEALFPTREESRTLAARNWSFAFRNPGMVLVFGIAYLIFNWLLDTNARMSGYGSLVGALYNPSWKEAMAAHGVLLFVSPWPFILMAISFGGYYYFAGGKHGWGRALYGGSHWAAQTLIAIVTTWLLVVCIGDAWPEGGWIAGLRGASTIVLGSLGAAFASATLFGLYLWVSLNGFGRHWNEAFSSLAISDFKNFLRLRIDRDGQLTVYAIGLRGVPEGGGTPESLHPHLIEDPVSIS